ncbi:MAG: hypothetical protein R3F21_08975 [Myxococcota bacterium]
MSEWRLPLLLDELESARLDPGFEVVGRVLQRRARGSPSAVVGSGKLMELAAWTGGTASSRAGPAAKAGRTKSGTTKTNSW